MSSRQRARGAPVAAGRGQNDAPVGDGQRHDDLIAMCTHRHSGSRFMLGSVADKVLRAGDLPVLMMHPHATHG